MSGREKIIVGLMIGSVIYGAYHFWGQYRSKININVLTPKIIEDKIKPIRESDIVVLSEKEKYILNQASAVWTQDPFIAPVPRQRLAKKMLPPAPKDLKYSGYLRMGDRILAIIDGMEYQVGESLLKSPYLISDISPRQVIIALPDGINSTHIPILDSE